MTSYPDIQRKSTIRKINSRSCINTVLEITRICFEGCTNENNVLIMIYTSSEEMMKDSNMTRVEKEEAASIKCNDLEKYSGWLNQILCIYNKKNK